MINRILSIALLLLGVTTFTFAQQTVSLTFKAGLNFSKLDGPLQSFGDKTLETYNNNSGFHVGAGANFRLTDELGVRAEFLYSQMGTEYQYDGPSYWVFFNNAGNPIHDRGGERRMIIDVTNSYLDLPVSIFYKYKRFEVHAGMSAGLLIGSIGNGELRYSNASSGVDEFITALDFRYLRDEPTTAVGEEVLQRTVNGSTVSIPPSLGAFYGALGQTENPFSNIDLAVHGGVSLFLNDGLYVGVRYRYGLVDVKEDEADISYLNLDENNNFIYKSGEVHRNIALQASVGFSF